MVLKPIRWQQLFKPVQVVQGPKMIKNYQKLSKWSKMIKNVGSVWYCHSDLACCSTCTKKHWKHRKPCQQFPLEGTAVVMECQPPTNFQRTRWNENSVFVGNAGKHFHMVSRHSELQHFCLLLLLCQLAPREALGWEPPNVVPKTPAQALYSIHYTSARSMHLKQFRMWFGPTV